MKNFLENLILAIEQWGYHGPQLGQHKELRETLAYADRLERSLPWQYRNLRVAE